MSQWFVVTLLLAALAAIAAWIVWAMIFARAQLASLWAWAKGWRTLSFGSFTALAAGALDLLQQLQQVDIAPLFPAGVSLKVIAGIGVTVVILRLITTSPAGSRG
jgi:hypothetical protein